MSEKPRVVVYFGVDGEINYLVEAGARLFVVDERAPHDRVYEWLPRDKTEAVQRVLGDGPVGSSSDGRHAAIERIVNRAIEGKRHLELLPPPPAER